MRPASRHWVWPCPCSKPTLTPDHRLWETLQTTSLRVKVIRPDPVSLADPDYWWEFCTFTTISKLGSILEVSGRAPDDRGRMLFARMGLAGTRTLCVRILGPART